VVQLGAGPDIDAGVAAALELCGEALADGAEIVVLPENYWGITSQAAKEAIAADPGNMLRSPLIRPFAALSVDSPSAWIILGGLPERPTSDDPASQLALLYNTLAVLHGGRVVAKYRKIHRFDADLPSGAKLRESATTAAGTRPLVIHTPLATIGLSICYDLRFPSLYRALSLAGAEIIVAPSAFTLETGLDHWQLLVRARALDTQSYVLAPGLHGRHDDRRRSFGHSMIVDPWGTVIAQSSRGDGVLSARLSAATLETIRREMPILQHHVLPSGPAADSIDLRGVT